MIPKHCIGADWRDLPDQLLPWCCTNTAHTHSDWKGCLGRLNWEWRWASALQTYANIYKAAVLHPEEDRIFSVREGARAMGFPDDFEFLGDLKEQYRQNGNAVPPPMAKAIAKEIVFAYERSE
jgi:DNA (cytosine-5)-methyltransferase 1